MSEESEESRSQSSKSSKRTDKSDTSDQLQTLTSLLNTYTKDTPITRTQQTNNKKTNKQKPVKKTDQSAKKNISLYRKTITPPQTPSIRPVAIKNEIQESLKLDGSDSTEDQTDQEIKEEEENNNISNDSSSDHQGVLPEIINQNNEDYDDEKDYNNSQDDIGEFSNIELPDELPYLPNKTKNIQQPSNNIQQSKQSSNIQQLSNIPNLSSQQSLNLPQQSLPLVQSSAQSVQSVQSQPEYRVKRKSVPGENYGIGSLTIVTYNIWYNKKDLVARTKQIVELIMTGLKHLPDLICMQEVTQRSYQIIEQAMKSSYYLFEVFGNDKPGLPYSNLIAINRKTLEIINDTLTAYDFDSQMGRKLMVCQVRQRMTDIKFHILNTHLESLQENWKYRKLQMESIHRLIKEEKLENFILVGDFNICRDQEPIESLLRSYEYQDAWIEMGSPQSLKYTYDYQLNSQESNNVKLKGRLDRILYRFADDKIVISKLKFIGHQKPNPSDHFGLLAEFMMKSNNNRNMNIE